MNNLIYLVSLIFLFSCSETNEREKFKEKEVFQEVLKEISFSNKYPEKILLDKDEYDLKYTINFDLQRKIERILKRYRSDHSAVVVLDNNTGAILASTGWSRKEGLNLKLSFSASHPSASLFKIVTSADLLEGEKVSQTTPFQYRGKGTTLYKYQLKNKRTKWTRTRSFKKAFANSNNVIFAKAAIDRTSSSEIYEMATRLGFNRPIMKDLEVTSSRFPLPKSQYNLAELATGFNKETLISPIHAALLSLIVANEGRLIHPYLVKSISLEKEGELTSYQNTKKEEVVFEEKVGLSLQDLMNLVTNKGTARSAFRRKNKSLRSYVIGGKTGSITGGIPFGKRDWFTMYAIPKKGDSDKGVSIAVMNINVKKWYIKSTHLARKVLEEYVKIKQKLKKNSVVQTAMKKS